MEQAHSFFLKRQKALFIASSAYVIFLILSHSTLPALHVWIIAMIFSIAMNFTYGIEAYSQQKFFTVEAGVAAVLTALSILGVLISPLFVIIAIFGHGVWDILKHLGVGIPFFRWYTLGCSVIDFVYSGTLFAYWLTNRHA